MLAIKKPKHSATGDLSYSAFRTEIVTAETQNIEQKMSAAYMPARMDNKDVEGVSGKNFGL